MTFDAYNALTSEDKIRFQWVVWDKFLATQSLGPGGFLWNRLYGHKRFMVNARNLLARDKYLFEQEEYLIRNVELPFTSKVYPFTPIMTMRNEFASCQEVLVKSRISNRRYHWLYEPIEKGEKFMVTPNIMNVCSTWGISVKIEKEGWELGSYELPLRSLKPINI